MIFWIVALYAVGAVLEVIGLLINVRGFRGMIADPLKQQNYDEFIGRMREKRSRTRQMQEAKRRRHREVVDSFDRTDLPPVTAPEFPAQVQARLLSLLSYADHIWEFQALDKTDLIARIEAPRGGAKLDEYYAWVESDKRTRRQYANVVNGWLFIAAGFLLQAVSQLLQFSQ